MAHGLSGTRRDRLGPFAERFSAAGFAALVFDHRGFGDSGGEPDLFRPRRQLEDWRAAIAFARSLPGVDAARVATFGSSMGGGNALAAAAEDPDVAAAISQVPFLDIVRQAHRSSPRSWRGCSRRRSGDGTCRPSASPTSRRSSTRPAARRAGAGWSRPARTRAGATGSPRAGSSAVPTVPPAMPPACTAPGSSASARPTGSPSPARRSPPRGAPRRASYAPTPASTTSTSTTAPSTRPSSPTSSTSSAATSAAP